MQNPLLVEKETLRPLLSNVTQVVVETNKNEKYKPWNIKPQAAKHGHEDVSGLSIHHENEK